MFSNRMLRSQAGFSMLELMVALGTTIVISAASFSLIGSSIKFANATYHLTDAEQSLRNAHEVINRDLTTAGDGLNGIRKITTPLAFAQSFLTRTPVINGSDTTHADVGLLTSDDAIPANTAVPQSSPAVNFLAGNDRMTMLVKDTSFPDVSVPAGKITQSGSNTLVVVSPADIGRFQVGEIYAFVSTDAAFGVVSSKNTSTNTLTFSNGDVYSINQTGSTSPIYSVGLMNSSFVSQQSASIVRFQIIAYYVDANNLLHRRVFGIQGGGFSDSVIAEHVTNFQFRFLTNLPDANGFIKQPVRVITSAEQTAVREVETTIAVETGKAVNAITNTNPSGRQTISSTTATTVRNLQFRYNVAP